MKVLVAVGWLVAVLTVGSGLAALPVTGNDPCSTWYGESEVDAQGPQAVIDLVPFGTRCEYPPGGPVSYEDHVPSTASYAAWLVVVAACFAFAVWRWRVAALRGAACALLIVGLLGLLWGYWGDYTAAAFSSCVLGAPLVFALDLRARADPPVSALFGVALPVVANAAWFVPGMLGSAAAVACAALAGALASFAVDHVSRSLVPRADAA